MKKVLSLVLALVLWAGLAVPARAAEAAFSDVPADHNFYQGIMDCASRGIVSGYSDGTFRPANTITRNNFVVMLSRAFYAGDVARYSTPVYLSQGSFVPNARALYANGILENTSFAGAFATGTVMNQGIDRYDMAQLMTNIMKANGFSASSADKNAAISRISDYSSIPGQYKDAVANVYALGIITGYGDGSFKGSSIMNRGAGAAVVYRMMQYVPASGGGNSEPHDDGTGETPSTSEPTLRNGQPVTEANVIALLNELKSMYPEGTSFANGAAAMRSNLGLANIGSDFNKVVAGRLNTLTGCGGWAGFVSDYIFGDSNAPGRKVTNNADIRPGDIVLCKNSNGKLTHVQIIASTAHRDNDMQAYIADVTDSTTNGTGVYSIHWNDGYNGVSIYDNDSYLEVWTRYPA